jgi:uncharacterized membrane protein YjgN (DUF898 family)
MKSVVDSTRHSVYTSFGIATPKDRNNRYEMGEWYTEFFKWLLCVACLVIPPLGMTMLAKRKASKTVLNGKRLAYDGTFMDLLIKQVIWCVLSCVTCGIYAFWLPVNHLKYFASHTHFEDGSGTSEFDGTALGLMLNWYVASLLSFTFILAPIAFVMVMSFKNAHTVIDGKRLGYDTTIWKQVVALFPIYGIAAMWLAFATAFLPTGLNRFVIENTIIEGQN